MEPEPEPEPESPPTPESPESVLEGESTTWREEPEEGPEVETITVQRHRRDINIDFGDPTPEETPRDKEELLREMAEELGEWERDHPQDLPVHKTPTGISSFYLGITQLCVLLLFFPCALLSCPL